jgi:hypothetical protein
MTQPSRSQCSALSRLQCSSAPQLIISHTLTADGSSTITRCRISAPSTALTGSGSLPHLSSIRRCQRGALSALSDTIAYYYGQFSRLRSLAPATGHHDITVRVVVLSTTCITASEFIVTPVCIARSLWAYSVQHTGVSLRGKPRLNEAIQTDLTLNKSLDQS